MKSILAALVVILSANPALATCYQLFGGEGVIYQDVYPPFDISFDRENGPSGDMLASRSRGEHLVLVEQPICPSVQLADLHPSIQENIIKFHPAGFRSPLGAIDSLASSDGFGMEPGAGSYGSYGSRPSAGTDVRVNSYHRRDGTFVPVHTRAAPGRGRR